jgi:uncharacterized membrane protein
MRMDIGTFVGWWIPGMMALLSLPMAMGMVPPNRFYGFRTAKTLSSPRIWYAANQRAGWLLFAAGVVSLLASLWITHMPGATPQVTQLLLTVVPGSSAVGAVLAMFAYLRSSEIDLCNSGLD